MPVCASVNYFYKPLQKYYAMKNQFAPPAVIIDNGHGRDTPGKGSPDGRLREWQWSRRCACELADALRRKGLHALRPVTEDNDIALSERVRRINLLCRQYPGAVLLSLHTNAAGRGDAWHEASGFSAFVSPHAGSDSRRLAQLLTARARSLGLEGDRATPATGYWQAPLYILQHTACPAVLTENLFHDNRRDVGFLLGDAGRRTIVELHADALSEYFGL